MFRRKPNLPQNNAAQALPRITSVVADGVSLRGKLSGAGGVRIEGAFDGEIELDGLLVIGPTGRVTCPQLKARHVIVAGAMRGDILAERVEIRASGRVWGNVITASMSTEEGAFLRGQIQMEEKVELGIQPPAEKAEPAPEPSPEPTQSPATAASHQDRVEQADAAGPTSAAAEKKFRRKRNAK
ncbi:MAG TPA: polymer-forming cytoskeletal protein [Anaerolineales bacterium]|nr:polymer-forming cytoskeletal protein [Anaerolineales bacterium]